MSIPPESRSTRAMEITRELFEEQKRPRFGNANPERMRLEAAIGRRCVLDRLR